MRIGIFVLSCVTITGASQAAVTSYTSRADLDQAILNSANVPVKEGFDGSSDGTQLANGSFYNALKFEHVTVFPSVMTIQSAANVSPPNVLGVVYSYPKTEPYDSGFDPSDTLTITLPGSFHFFGVSFNTVSFVAGDFSATTSEGDVVVSVLEPLLLRGALGQFIGFYSDTAFTSITLQGGAQGQATYAIDDVTWSGPAIVPLPAAAGTGLAGLSTLLAVRRRRVD